VPRQVAECGVACCWPAPTISRLRSGRGVSPEPGLPLDTPTTPRVFFVAIFITNNRNAHGGRASGRGPDEAGGMTFDALQAYLRRGG
jgi:hypothetical protein